MEIGVFSVLGEEITLTDSDLEDLTKRALIQNLADIMSNPLEKSTQSYKITFVDEVQLWRCVYFVLADEDIFGMVFGYGSFELESIESCLENLENLGSD